MSRRKASKNSAAVVYSASVTLGASFNDIYAPVPLRKMSLNTTNRENQTIREDDSVWRTSPFAETIPYEEMLVIVSLSSHDESRLHNQRTGIPDELDSNQFIISTCIIHAYNIAISQAHTPGPATQ